MSFFAFIGLLLLIAIAYLLWRISLDLPDIVFRIADIHREITSIREQLNGQAPSSSEQKKND